METKSGRRWTLLKGKLWVQGSVLLGILALAYYFAWFVDVKAFHNPWLIVLLILAVLYSGIQMLGNWILYFLARRSPPAPPPDPKQSIDVMITVYNEPVEMIQEALAAAVAMTLPHRTWLLDDGPIPGLAALADEIGVGYLTRPDRQGAKAGNLNGALPRTQGEIIAIFDVDHVPEQDYLERTVGYFTDPGVGFVQVMLTFDNTDQSWVAQSASETSLEFYNPTSVGTNWIGSTTLMGSNALIRRKALESINGYQTGLAEDLATSIALHAAGWKSVYVHEPLAPGIAPPDLEAWFTQQLKWARGVFELLLTAYPRAFSRITWGQRLSYAVRMTKYWVGPAVCLHLYATIGVLILGNFETRAMFHEYLRHITPLAFMDVLIRYIALRTWRKENSPRTSLLRAVTLVYATWPIYMFAWLMALLRLPLGFRPTPKNISGKLNPLWLVPQILAIGLLAAGSYYTVFVLGHPLSLLLGFAIIQGFLQLILLYQWLNLEGDLKKKATVLLQTADPAIPSDAKAH